MSGNQRHHRQTTKSPNSPHGRDVFGLHDRCDCLKCDKYRHAVTRLVDSFSLVPSRWIAELADHRSENVTLPMWDTLFWPNNSVDIRNIERLLVDLSTEGDADRETLKRCGWRQVADTGVLAWRFDDELLLGIDGAGYDFFTEHWEPLYAALGYQWHE